MDKQPAPVVAASSETQEQWLASRLMVGEKPVASWEGDVIGQTETFRINQPWRICGYSFHARPAKSFALDGKLEIIIHGAFANVFFPMSAGPLCSAINLPGVYNINIAAEDHWSLAAYYVNTASDAEMKAEMPVGLPHRVQ